MARQVRTPQAAPLLALLLLAAHCGPKDLTTIDVAAAIGGTGSETPLDGPATERRDDAAQLQSPDAAPPDGMTPPDDMRPPEAITPPDGVIPDGSTPAVDEMTWFEVPEYVPDVIVLDEQGIAYLLSREQRQVFRFDTEGIGWSLQPIPLGAAGAGALSLAVAANRLYVGYDSGEIQYLDTRDPLGPALVFATLPEPVTGLTPIGERLMALGDAAGTARHHLFDASGIETASSEWSIAYDNANVPRYFEGSTYDPVLQRFYFFCDEAGARDVCAEQIDAVAGTLGAYVYAQDHALPAAPIRVSLDGTRVLTGTGMWYDADGLQRHPEPLTTRFVDAAWLPRGGLMTIHGAGWYGEPATRFERRDGIGRLLESDSIPGEPYAVFSNRTGRVVIGGSSVTGFATSFVGPAFHGARLEPDSDADGVLDDLDAFPLDVAASLDEDRDGAPDSWNPGSDGSGSLLTLDVYPRDPACHRLEQGDGVFCNRLGEPLKLPPPRQLAIDNYGMVYLLGDDQVRRWDYMRGQALPPIHLEGDRAPTAVVSDGLAVLVADDTGSVTTLDFPLSDRTVLSAQRELLRVSPHPGLAMPDRLLVVQDHGSEPERLLFFGETLFARHSVEDAAETIYSFHNSASYDGMHLYSYSASAGLIDTTLDPDTGAILTTEALPIEGGELHPPLLRVGVGFEFRLLAGNVIYDPQTRTPVQVLDPNIVDAMWLYDESLALIRKVPGTVETSVLERRDAAGELVEQRSYPLAPLRLLRMNEYLVIATWNADPVEATLQFDSYHPHDFP